MKNPYLITAALMLLFAAVYGLLWLRKRNKKLRPELEEHINKLHPKAQKRFRAFLRDVERKLPYKVKVWSSHRGYDHAARLKAQLPELQKCCPIGGDYHFYGFAIDIGLEDGNGKILGLGNSKAEWEQTGIRKLAEKHGLRWGIDFLGYRSPSDDPVHFDWPGYSIAQLQKAAINQYGSIKATNNNGNRINLRAVPSKQKEAKRFLLNGWADCSNPDKTSKNLCK